MKIKQTIPFLLALFCATVTLAQSGESGKVPVIIAEAGIKTITISDNIDLLLINAGPEDIKTTVPKESVDKLKIFYSQGNLSIKPKGYLPSGERIPVFVYVDDLQSLTLLGNSFARSRDVLTLTNLRVNIENDGRVALRSTGKVRVNAPQDYHILNEERYHLVLSQE